MLRFRARAAWLSLSRCRAVLVLWFGFVFLPASVDAQDLIKQGEYVARAAGCVACHTDIENDGDYLAGGRVLQTPFGDFYSPNITPHSEHGIGAWSKEDLQNALTKGLAPDGSHYYPVFPYTAYSAMRQEDIEALFAYLKTVPQSSRQNQPHDLSWFVDSRFANTAWQWMFFEPKPAPENRGEYLVKALGHCDECHTPRDMFGALDYSRHLAGNPDGVEGEPVPNITPHREEGIGRWGESGIASYLRNGMLPDGDFAGSLMVDVIDEGTSYLTREDRQAIAAYLKSLVPLGGE